MNILDRIKGRIKGIENDINSHYWEYVKYFYDDIVWDKTVLFESFNGINFQGNPYYLFVEFFNNTKYKDYTFYISNRNIKKCSIDLKKNKLWDDRVMVVETNSKQYRIILSHAHFLVNNVSFPMQWIKKNKQIYLNTQHGTPLKYLGRRISTDPYALNNTQRNLLLADIAVVPNKLTEKIYLEDYMIHDIMPGKLILAGYPRNAIFLDKQQQANLSKKLKLVKDHKIKILYMPTWRGNMSEVKDIDYLNDIERLAIDLGENYSIYAKLHPAAQNIAKKIANCKSIPEGIEIYSFLSLMDILITDYSSVFYDFANTGKRIILYQPDKEEYFSSRGFYSELLNEIPYPVVQSYEELYNTIRHYPEIDDTIFKEKICFYDNKNASSILARCIHSYEKSLPSNPVDLYIITKYVEEQDILQWSIALKNSAQYRFVFVPSKKNNGFRNIKCFDKLDYLIYFNSTKLTIADFFNLDRAREREIKRLWGDINIGNVYIDSSMVPFPFGKNTKKWPNTLSTT